MTAYPLALALPSGTATLVYAHPSAAPRCVLDDGETIAVDVQIPADLLAAGWHWHDSFLALSPDRPGAPGLAICTQTFPPPRCYDEARRHTERWRAYRAEQEAERAGAQQMEMGL